MLRRWKQLIREKTGHAQQTQLPEDVEKFMDMTFELRNTMEKIDKSVEDLIAGWRSVRMNVQEQIGEPCGILSMKAEGSGQLGDVMKLMHELHKDLGRIERRTHLTIQRGFLEDVCQMFLRIENKQAIDICNDLKRTRLEIDSCAEEYNKKTNDPSSIQAMEFANYEFKSAIQNARIEFNRYPTQHLQHADSIKILLEQLAHHYAECRNTTTNAISFMKNLEKGEESSSKHRSETPPQ